MNLGKFITFEGGEGSGKSTQIDILQKRLVSNNIPTFVTREPGGTTVGEKIRQILVEGSIDKILPTTELLLHLASRIEHLNISILPMLKKGNLVLCDRFIDSTIAYQGVGHNLGISKVQLIHQHVGINIRPDLTYILDIPVAEGLNRSKSRKNNENRYETMDKSFHEKIRKAFIEIAKNRPKNYIIIDANKPTEEISEIIWNDLNFRFEFNNNEQ
tara:strand:- start:329 stop:973 length:645 start_codon:yes stop_codon:yes gene_type:complete